MQLGHLHVGKALVSHAHDGAISRPGSYLQLLRAAVALNDQAVVPRCWERVGESLHTHACRMQVGSAWTQAHTNTNAKAWVQVWACVGEAVQNASSWGQTPPRLFPASRGLQNMLKQALTLQAHEHLHPHMSTSIQCMTFPLTPRAHLQQPHPSVEHRGGFAVHHATRGPHNPASIHL